MELEKKIHTATVNHIVTNQQDQCIKENGNAGAK